jgi:hypothetical protein
VVSLVDDRGPVALPVFHVRRGDELLFHGSPHSRLVGRLVEGVDVCVTATILDGLVLARSAFAHSANYRSVVVFGRSRPVEDLDQRRKALDAFTDKVVPGRRPTLRPMSDKEVAATAVVAVTIEEASVKSRTGPPADTADAGLPIWAGVVPLRTGYGDPLPAPDLPPDATEPSHLGFFRA